MCSKRKNQQRSAGKRRNAWRDLLKVRFMALPLSHALFFESHLPFSYAETDEKCYKRNSGN
jgi:hypothetical protein